MKKLAIIGFGLEGKSLFSYFSKSGKYQIYILDKNKNTKVPAGAEARLGKNYLKNLKDFDIIFRSPGVPYNLPELGHFRKKLSSLTKLFFEKAPGKIIGITGSVGKTTTAVLLYEILKSASRRTGKRVYLAGNIGLDPLKLISKLNKNSIVVFELSSFQLQDLNSSPKLAIILDIFEEHLDKHKNFKEYLSAKSSIVRYQKKADAVIYAEDNKFSKKIAATSKGKKIPVSVSAGKKLGFRLKLPGDFNYKNVMAAYLASLIFGADEKRARNIIEGFRGIEHRLEFVRKKQGIRYFNNSKATNPAAAIAGLNAVQGMKIAIVGGSSKNLNLKPLIKRLKSADIRHAVFFGALRSELKKISLKTGFKKFSLAKNLTAALRLSSKKAKRGDGVVLSPGAASFDEFKNYEERGEKFKKEVKKLK